MAELWLASSTEAFAVARHLGVVLAFFRRAEYREAFFQKLLPSTYDHHPTMLHNPCGRGRTEIDSLNGRVVAIAQAIHLDAEMNRTLTALIHTRQSARAILLGWC